MGRVTIKPLIFKTKTSGFLVPRIGCHPSFDFGKCVFLYITSKTLLYSLLCSGEYLPAVEANSAHAYIGVSEKYIEC